MPTIDDLSDELAHSKSEDLSSSPTQPDPKLHEVDDDDDDEVGPGMGVSAAAGIRPPG